MTVPIIKKSHLWKIHGDASSSRAFARASGFGPLPQGMPFYHPIELERKLAFWKVNPMPPGLTVEGGSKWPDFIAQGGGHPWFFVSERVVDSLNRIAAPIHRLTEMPIGVILTKALRTVPAPRYFVVETEPGIEVDLAASGYELAEDGKPKRRPFSTSPSPFKYRGSSWNGTDLFDYHNFLNPDLPHTNLLCSQKLKELAEKEKWTNVGFTNMALV